MTDEIDLLRAADPAPADEGPWRDRPLSAEAERRLNRLLREGRARCRRRTAWGLATATAATAAVVALAVLFGGAATRSAVDAPSPLSVDAGAPAVPLAELAERVRRAAANRTAAPLPGTDVQTWSMGLRDDGSAAPVTVAEERTTRRHHDGSWTETVVATDPRRPGRPVLTGDGPAVGDRTVLSETTRLAGNAPDTSYPESPPHTVTGLRAYLLHGARLPDPPGLPALLDAVSAYLKAWTPGPRETAALVGVLAAEPGLRPAGTVTDRLGRTGLAYVYDSPADRGEPLRRLVILDPRDGRVLGMEITYTRDIARYRVTAGSVMSYEAWLR
ncbi:CU044_5270 family protein [Streptomyces sp. NPDC050509]|uniref:CU044_5270 family protein n=1 Tax=Streptomyces sp. NPDC050509 TaxID=3365620 RepID=UPI00379BE864